VTGNWVMRCEMRTLDDIRALGGNDAEDERRFATAARVSEINLALYRAFVEPAVQAVTSSPVAEWMQRMHPLRLQYGIFSNTNPFMAMVTTMAEHVRKDRKPVAAGNPFIAMQEYASHQIVAALDSCREMSEALAERTFLAIYGSPVLQAAVGIDQSHKLPLRKASKNLIQQDLLQKRSAELKARIPAGGLREAMMRAMLYVGMARAAVDERGFEAVRRIRKSNADMPLAAFKALVREQFNILLLDTEAALAGIPAMLPSDAEKRLKAFTLIKTALGARGETTAEDTRRMAEVARLFGVDAEGGTTPTPLRQIRREPQARAS
jgi:protein-disulfide isomerase-like protein with CxxC motif